MFNFGLKTGQINKREINIRKTLIFKDFKIIRIFRAFLMPVPREKFEVMQINVMHKEVFSNGIIINFFFSC